MVVVGEDKTQNAGASPHCHRRCLGHGAPCSAGAVTTQGTTFEKVTVLRICRDLLQVLCMAFLYCQIWHRGPYRSHAFVSNLPIGDVLYTPTIVLQLQHTGMGLAWVVHSVRRTSRSRLSKFFHCYQHN